MNWIKEAEHRRDYGHTWGPGFEKEDDVELTAEELAEEERRHIEYEKEIANGRVAAREKYVLAGQEMKKALPSSHDITFGLAPLGWREAYSTAKIELCEQAAKELGYTLSLRDRSHEDKNGLIVEVERYGGLPHLCGHLHRYAVAGIYNIEDCLQLVADFHAIGMNPTTHYKDNLISLNDTGELRREMKWWDICFEEQPASVVTQIENAKNHQQKSVAAQEKERSKGEER